MAKQRNKARQDGRVCVRVYLGIIDGKAKYKYCYGHSQKEAEEKALAIKLDMRKGLDVVAANNTFGEWAEVWLEQKQHEVSTARLVAYTANAKHLTARFGQQKIAAIKTADLQKLVYDLAKRNPNTGRPMASKTLRGIKSTAQQIFATAIANRVIDYNPAAAVRVQTENRKVLDRRALTKEEQAWFLDTPHRCQTAALLMMLAGLRRGEAVALRWSDVDFDEKTITINKAAEVRNGRFIVKPFTKTAAGMRTIPMPKTLVDHLRKQEKKSVFVCPAASGRMHTLSSFRRMWESYLHDLNYKYGGILNKPKSKYYPKGIPFVIPKITPHFLRHTYATNLYLAGVDILTAKTLLGHADIKTTLNIYTHLDEKYAKEQVKKLDQFLYVCQNEGQK